MSDKRELHSTRLGTTDERGARVMPLAEYVKGKWASRRSIIFTSLIAFYLILPWIYVDGKQIVLLNIPKREFYLFGTMFHAHDSVFLIFVLLGFLLGIALVTSVLGRVWCGWACPQTVFIDHIYRRIERVVEGNARARKALNQGELSFQKVWKKSLKWALYLIVSLHIVHSFLGYFVGTRALVEISFQSPSNNWFLFLTMLILTGITLFDFGWFREQFCVIACPYGRFQSVLMDESSLVVAYDDRRGEPRRSKEVPRSNEGDCINCFKCVKVCPTGIDIRRGTQMECIACTACIDACDEIMGKVGKPKGLIRYTSEKELQGEKRRVAPRTFIYGALLAAVIIGAVAGLGIRKSVKAQFLRMPGAPYMESIVDGKRIIINRFEAKVNVVGREKRGLFLSLELAPELLNDFEIVSGMLPKSIDEDRESISFFLKFSKAELTHGSRILPIKIKVLESGTVLEESDGEVKLVGPL